MQKHTIILIRNASAFDFGGGERFPVFVAEILAQHNYAPVIISRHKTLREFATDRHIDTVKGWWWSRQQWSGARIALIPVYILWQVALYVWYRIQFARLNPVAVHVQSKDDFIAATYAGKHHGSRVVWTDHADLKHVWKNVSAPYKNPVGKLVLRAARLADSITVVSESERREVTANLSELSNIRTKINVVYNGCQDVLPLYPRHNESGHFTLVFAGRLVTDKGIGETLAAFAKFHDEHPEAQLLVAGDGPERETFERIAKNIPDVTFLGYQKNPYATIRRGDVFLQPTYHEGFSVALVEASMLEMPIIATRVGGNIEIIQDHISGILISPRDVDALFGAMNLLYADAGLRASISKAAREQYSERFIFDKIVMEQFVPRYLEMSHD